MATRQGFSGLATILLAIGAMTPSAASIAAKKGSAVAHGVKKPDAVDTLLREAAANSIRLGEPPYAACLHSNFKGYLWALKDFWGSSTPAKTEFQTEAEFDKKIADFGHTLFASRLMIVCQSLADNDDVPFKYDAEAQLFSSEFSPTLRALVDYRKTGSYIGRTSLGAKAAVTSTLYVNYELAMWKTFMASTPPCMSGGISKVSFTVPVPVAEAPSVKAHALLVIEGMPGDPMFDISKERDKATLDDPRDQQQITLTAGMRPERLSIVMPDGRVVWECQIAKSEPPAK